MAYRTASDRRPLDGIWLPLITPFRDGDLDDEAVVTLVRHYTRTPISGFILAATTGEGLTLDAAETERLVKLAAEAAGGKLPLYLGLSGSDTAKMAKSLAATRDWPIAGYLIACPYYTRPSQEGLYQHFAALAAASDKPIILYNIPYRTGVNLANETLFRLAAIPAQGFDLLRGRPAGFSVLTGEDALFYSAIAHGADGGILASAHVGPAAFARVRDDLLAGNREGALRRWSALVDVVTLLFAEPSPSPIKYWLWRAGLLPSPEVRLPMTPVSDALARRIDAAIEARVLAA
jgi:4-hydroxy-tetrahydrodipicolinate synthase